MFGAAINKYCYISVRALPPFFEHRHRIVYFKIETVREIADIQHPAVRGVLSDMAIEQGLEIHHDADLPARSGLGSSSSFTVGLLKALYVFRGETVGAAELGCRAIHIEQDVIKEAVGCQDQLWAAHGGLNRIDFSRDGAIAVTPIDLGSERRDELRQSLMLFFTGFSRPRDGVCAEPDRQYRPARFRAENDARDGRSGDRHRSRSAAADLSNSAGCSTKAGA